MALHMAAGRSRSDLSDDPMLAMALTRALEIIGEAASRISDETRLRFASIPYAKMVAMRNRLIHAYFDVDLDIVVLLVTAVVVIVNVADVAPSSTVTVGGGSATVESPYVLLQVTGFAKQSNILTVVRCSQQIS